MNFSARAAPMVPALGMRAARAGFDEVAPVATGGRSGKLWQLKAYDDQANTARRTTCKRERKVFDQFADAEKTDKYLNQPAE